MTTAASFFKRDASQKLGVFYPTDYMVATFVSDEIAKRARQRLEENGIKSDDIVVLTGHDFIALSNEIHDEASTWSKFSAGVSKIVGTEELQLDFDLKHAQNGAAFLAVYCPTQEEGQRLFNLLRNLSPLSMRRYSRYAIDRMA
jgi:hypothetical protein